MKLLHIRVFGSFEVHIDGVPMRKLRTHRGNYVLALISLRLGKPIDRVFLATTVWPDSDHQDAMYSLRRTLSDLRSALGIASDAIVAPSPSTVQLDLGVSQVDLAEFASALENGPEQGVLRAMDLYRGPLLEEWRFDWVQVERSIRERELVDALVKLADRSERAGDNATAITTLRRLSLIDPHDESIFRRLISSLVQDGNHAAAQKAYDEFRRRLKQDLDIAPGEQTVELVRTLLTQGAKTSDSTRFIGGNLPAPTNALVGRRSELADIIDALKRERLVTLTGVGGVGKTRLAIDVVRQIVSDTGERAFAVDLLAIRDSDHLWEGFAAAAKSVDPDSSASPRQIVDRLVDVDALVLMDNCEHLLKPIHGLVSELIERCPKIRILATSQARIGIAGERVILIAPMPFPEFENASFSHVKDSDAVRLLVQYISRSKGVFELDQRNYGAVCRICRTLEGVPLALELAATRARLLSVDQIANLLEDRFRLLRTTEKGIEERHRTLQATMDWSYSLLSEEERELLQTVSVFAGFWTSESAAKVHGQLDNYEVLDVLERLVDRSLVLSDPSHELPRFRLLDSVRQYAADRLAEHGRSEMARDRHLAWFCELCIMAGKGFPGSDQRFWVDRIEVEYENVAAALAWAKLSASRTGQALSMVASLFRYWWLRGELTLGREILAKSIEMAQASTFRVPYAQALYSLATLTWSQGDNSESIELQLRALAIFESEGDVAGAAACLRNLSQSTRNLGRYQESLDYAHKALGQYRAVGNELMAAYNLVDMGLVTRDLLASEEAISYFLQAIEYARAQGVLPLQGNALLNMGSALYLDGNFEAAQDALEEAQQIFDRIGGRIMATMSRNGLALTYSELGDVPKGKAILSSSLDTFVELGEKAGICLTFEAVSTVAACAGDYEMAATLHGTAAAMREQLSIPRTPADIPLFTREIETVRSALTDEIYVNLRAEGQSVDLTTMIARANQWLHAPARTTAESVTGV